MKLFDDEVNSTLWILMVLGACLGILGILSAAFDPLNPIWVHSFLIIGGFAMMLLMSIELKSRRGLQSVESVSEESK